MPNPFGDDSAAAGVDVHGDPSLRSLIVDGTVPSGPPWPTPGTTLAIACDWDGDLYAQPMSQIGPEILVCGRSVPVFGPGTARSVGAADLPEPWDRLAWCSDVKGVLSRPFRLVYGRAGMPPASWVPSWALLHDDGTVTIVDHLRSECLTGEVDLLPMMETAALVKARGWKYELITAADSSVDSMTLAEVVLDAPDGLISPGLWAAAVTGAPVAAQLDMVRTPEDLLWIRPFLLSCWADEDARRAAEPPTLFGA